MSDSEDVQWNDCVSCKHPFPILGGYTDMCIACRKRALEEALNKSDITAEYLHSFYQKRIAAFEDLLSKTKAQLAAARRQSQPRPEVSLETETLKGMVRDLQARGAQLHMEMDSYRTEAIRSRFLISALQAEILMLQAQPRSTEVKSDFEQPEVNFLLQVAHPDRHPGEKNSIATAITKKLITLRKALKGS